MTTTIVEARDLKKFFVLDRSLLEQVFTPFAAKRSVCVLNGICFSVEPGKILGIVGPNGAGKTTLLRILADLLEPDSGWVALCGQRMNSNKYSLRSKIGYVSCEERSFFWRLTGRQNLEFFARLYGVPKTEIHKKIRAMLNMFALERKADQLFRDYSTGMRKKFALARALIHQPNILLLDEITNSLDPQSTQSIKAIVRDYVSSRKECCGVWSTHRLEEIGEICDEVLIINEGCAKYFESVSELTKRCDYECGFLKDINLKGEVFHSVNTILAER